MEMNQPTFSDAKAGDRIRFGDRTVTLLSDPTADGPYLTAEVSGVVATLTMSARTPIEIA